MEKLERNEKDCNCGFLKKLFIESSFLLFVTFDIMFGRQYISQTRSSDLIHMH